MSQKEEEHEECSVMQQLEKLMMSFYNSDEWKEVKESNGPLEDGGFLLNPVNYVHAAGCSISESSTITVDKAINNLGPPNLNNSTSSTTNWKVNNAATPPSFHKRTVRRHVQHLEDSAKTIAKGNIDYAIVLNKKLQDNLIKRREQFDVDCLVSAPDTSKDSSIVNNTSKFLSLPVNTSSGRMNAHLESVLRGVWCSASGGDVSARFLAKRFLNSNNRRANQGQNDRRLVESAISCKDNIFASALKQKERGDKLLDVAKKWIYSWQHDENISRVESNVSATFKVFNPLLKKQDEHQKRSYIDKGGMKLQYHNFKKSHFYTKFVDEVMSDETKNQFFIKRDTLPSISLETFRLSLCKCVGDPTTQSCVDVRQDKVFLSGVAMEAFIYKERMEYEKLLIQQSEESDEDELILNDTYSSAAADTFYSKLNNCTCQLCMKYREKFGDSPWTTIFTRKVDSNVAYRLVRKCLCPKETCPDLQFESEQSPPHFHKWACASSNCRNCGIETLSWSCETLSHCTTMIPVQVWEEAKRTGDQTQLEILDKVLPVCDIMDQLKIDLKIYMQHYVDIQLYRRMKDLDVHKQDPSTLLVFTDFAAMIDYRANKTLCGHQDHHGVLQIFYVLSNPRNIKLIQDDGETAVKKIRDCEVFYVFGGTEDRGKKHDWVFHNAALDYIVEKKMREVSDKAMIKSVRIYTDNCGAQYKCRQNFYNLSKLPEKNDRVVIAEHLFAPIYGFKGPWDAAGKVAKYLVKNMEKKEIERIPDAFKHYQVMVSYLKQIDTIDWEQLEFDGDDNDAFLSLTAFTATKRHSLYATDDKDEYEKLKRENNDIIFTNRKAREINDDTEPYPNSSRYYHVIGHGKSGADAGKMKIEFRNKFCFCNKCRSKPTIPDIGSGCKHKDLIGEIASFERNPSTEKNNELVTKLNQFVEMPTYDQLDHNFKLPALRIFAKILDINVNKDIKRSDGKKGTPLKGDILAYLILQFKSKGWEASKDIINQNWQNKRATP